jgi:hypothetical protein
MAVFSTAFVAAGLAGVGVTSTAVATPTCYPIKRKPKSQK